MNSRLKIGIGVAIAVIVLMIGIAIAQNQSGEPEMEQRTELSSSTSTTEGAEAVESADRTERPDDDSGEGGDNRRSVREVKNESSASYVAYSYETFAETDGTRILFFHDKDDEDSEKNETFIRANLKKMPGNVTFFEVDYSAEEELVKAYSISKPTIMLSFNDDEELQGIYGTPDPILQSMMMALQIAEDD